jgi:hypothetical protein
VHTRRAQMACIIDREATLILDKVWAFAIAKQ